MTGSVPTGSVPVGGAMPTDTTPGSTPVDTMGGPAATPATPGMTAEGPGAVNPACGKQVSFSKPCTSDPDPCGLKSGFVGDEYCLLPPKADEGIQIHFGPKDYKNPGDYAMKPGQEDNNSVLAKIEGLTAAKMWQHVNLSMRPGSHHWITMSGPANGKEGFYADTGCGTGALFGGGGFGGGQTLVLDDPPGGVPAPENVGLGRSISPGTMCFGLHAYNFTSQQSLREIWINLYFIDPSKVTQRTGNVGGIGGFGLNLPPGQSKTEMYSMSASGAGRIIQLFGHRHEWTPHFSAWLDNKLIYDSWSWKESVVFNYNSITMNPPINADAKTDGALSGPQMFNAGAQLKFACYIENTSKVTLQFKNDLDMGEMCNMWGTTVGGSFSGMFQ